jgi:hypothetical protein
MAQFIFSSFEVIGEVRSARVLAIKFPDSWTLKRNAPAQVSDQHEWQQDSLPPENESSPNFTGVGGPMSKCHAMKKVALRNVPAESCHQILSERAEKPEGNSPQTENSIWQ